MEGVFLDECRLALEKTRVVDLMEAHRATYTFAATPCLADLANFARRCARLPVVAK